MTIALALAVILQGEVEKLVEQLESDRIEERDAAAARILKLGEPALATLRKNLDHRNPEVRSRVRTIIDDLEFLPEFPPALLRRHPDAMSRLRSGTVQERLGFVKRLEAEGLLPPCLAVQIVMKDGSPEVRAAAAGPLTRFARPRHKPALLRLASDWGRSGEHGVSQRIVDESTLCGDQEALLSALWSVVSRDDAAPLKAIAKNDRIGLADVLLSKALADVSEARLNEIVQSSTSYPVAARAAGELARRFGPAAIREFPTSKNTYANWCMRECILQGLLDNGKPEAIEAVERIAETELAVASQSTCRLVARAGTEKVAKALIAFAATARQPYDADTVVSALSRMPPAIVFKALKAANSPLIARFGRTVLLEGTEEEIVARLSMPEPPVNLHWWAWPPIRRDEVTRACRTVVEKGGPSWAVEFAYRQVHFEDKAGAAERASRILRNPQHPAFLYALTEVDSMEAESRRTVLPAILKRLESCTKDEVYAFARGVQPEWTDALRRIAADKKDPRSDAAMFALSRAHARGFVDRIEFAKEFPSSTGAWGGLWGRIPRERWDELRGFAKGQSRGVRIEIARALLASGDRRSWDGMDWAPETASLLVRLAGRDCTDEILAAIKSSNRRDDELLAALSAARSDAVETYLLDRMSEWLIVEENFKSGPHPDPCADAVFALVNLRSEKLRGQVVRLARLHEADEHGYWEALVHAMGALDAPDARRYILDWLDECEASDDRAATLLRALSRIGVESDTNTARRFLVKGAYGSAVAVDRLKNREWYRRAAAVKELDAAETLQVGALAAALEKYWGVQANLEGLDFNFGSVTDYPVLRGDGFTVIDRIAAITGRIPMRRGDRIEFVSIDEAVRQAGAK